LKPLSGGEAVSKALVADTSSLKPISGKGISSALGGIPPQGVELSKLPALVQDKDATLASTTGLDASLVILKPVLPKVTDGESSADPAPVSIDNTAPQEGGDGRVEGTQQEPEEEGKQDYEDEFIDLEEETKNETTREFRKDSPVELEAEIQFPENEIELKPDLQSLFNTKREVDSALYSRILMMRPRGPTQDLLHAAATDQDLIGVQMVPLLVALIYANAICLLVI
jgi:hypothetical protein